MSSAVKKKTESSRSRTTRDKIENTYTNELIIGICSPIGSSSQLVIEKLKERLHEYNYETEVIKLSKFIEEYFDKEVSVNEGESRPYAELMHKINGGDYLRKEYNNNSILAELAIKKIREDRGEEETTEMTSRRKCYIIDSLKNLEELELLRSIYRDIFYLFSIFSSEKERKANLRSKDLTDTEIDKLISTDEYENNNDGQNVRNTFINGDFFLRVSETNKEELPNKIKRYMHLIFSSDIITPNYYETAMHQAKSTAGNSACLSRQVGATITDKQGVVIARGWNDVPKYGGNLYKDGDEPNRCKDLGYCSNIRHRNEILVDIREEIEKVISPDKTPIRLASRDKYSAETQKIMEIISKSKFKNIIEYSRSIHAEMHAIIIGSQMTGDRMVEGSLFCTTYPCHNCARHIVLAGIKKVYYIEPYKKSLGITLHGDALTEDEDERDKVQILPYDGVAPRRYLDFFGMKEERKSKDGNITNKNLGEMIPRNRLSLQAIPTLENQAVIALYDCGLIREEVEDE